MENKRDVRTSTSAKLGTIAIQVQNAGILMAHMNAHVPMDTLVMAKIAMISMNVKMVTQNVTKTPTVSMSQDLKTARVTFARARMTISMSVVTVQNAGQ